MFYERLQEACKKNNIKLTPLVIDLGLSRGNINNWKSGVIPNGKILQMLSERLGVSVSWLLGKDEPVTPQEADELYKMYEELPEEAKAKAREYIELLLLQQKSEKK